MSIPNEISHPMMNRILRYAAIFLALLFFIGLPREDVSMGPVTVYAALWAIWLALRVFINQAPSIPIWQRLLYGVLIAGAVPLFAVCLLLFKSGLHAHGFPEYSAQQLITLLWQTPWWALGGAVGAGLWVLFKHFLGSV